MANKSTQLATVGDLMSAHVVSLRAGSTMHEAIQLMVGNRIHALPIVDQNNRCVGIITGTDLIEVTYDLDNDLAHSDLIDPSSLRRVVERIGDAIGPEPVESYASESVSSVRQGATLVAAAKIMTREQVHHLPVIADDETLLGILSSMDLVAAMADDE